MTLESDLFKGNEKLKDCENKDSAHIVADEPPNRRGVNDQGEHVKLIHKALRRVMSNPKFGLEEATETYGPLTAEVVRQFKLGPPMILNEALRQTTPDNIVGRKTIKALDKAVKRSNDRELPDFPIPPINPQEFQIVEFNESAPFLIFRKSHNPQEDDLDITKRRPTVSLSAPQQKQLQLAQSMGETLCRSTMKFELGKVAVDFGKDMAERFFRNNAVKPILFSPGDRLTQKVQSSPTFLARQTELVNNITTILKKGIQQRKVCDYHDLAVAKKSVDFELPSFPFLSEPILKGTIGGMKGADVSLVKFDANRDPRRWTGTLQYVLVDHFGVNDSDLIFGGGHGSQGQHCMWVLQHEHHPGNCPFISTFTFQMNVAGNL